MALLLSEADVARCVSMADLIPLMRETLGRFSRREAVQPVRTNLAIRPAGGYYGVMPAHLPGPDGGRFGLKSVSFFPGNDALGRPTHLATILLLDGRSGDLLAIMDGRLITEMRTAAVSAVSVQLLARENASRLALVGAGVQARSHLQAIAMARRLSRVTVWSRSRERAAAFVREMAAVAPCPIEAVDSVRSAVEDADIIATVSSASEPVLEGGWVAPGAHLCVVGSSHPRKREVDSATVARSRVFVDSRDAARVEAGDLLLAEKDGAWSLDSVAGELGEVVNAAVPGRTGGGELTLFKSLGIGVEDIASASLVLDRAMAAGLGTTISI